MKSINKPILHLNVKKKWFDMIKSGEKKEEYRAYSKYWKRIFIGYPHIRIKNKYYDCSDVIICFSNGYQKNRRQMYFEIDNLYYGMGYKEWGAPKEPCFILKLGEQKKEI